MDVAWMAPAAVAAVLASWASGELVWRPRAITRELGAQGVGGPGYKFLAGNLGEIKQLRAASAGAVLAIGSHDLVPIVQPHLHKWTPLHGT
jgi:cytochrome P450 family 709